MQERLAALEQKRADALGSLADAARNVRDSVLGQIDREIVETRQAIDNFEWAKSRYR